MPNPKPPVDHRGRPIDYGQTAADYDRYRPGFPDSLFERLQTRTWIREGVRTLDLGTGTGALALGLARRRLEVTALDPSRPLLEVARRRAEKERLDVRFAEGTAEATGEDPGTYDLITAGQCWWWFDAPRALAEARRVLRPRGRLLIANFCYLPLGGNVAEQTEALILEHNPGWPKAGESGFFESQILDLHRSNFEDIESFSYIEAVPFTHEGWRGRIRACNGVGAALPPERVEAFDRALARLLADEHPPELVIPHRVFVATGRPTGP